MCVQPFDTAPIEDEGRPKPRHAVEILVVGQDDWAVNDATSQLQAADRIVHRCSESTESPFPCNAFIPGRGCPLDRRRVDVVLNIRTRPNVQPTLAEMGAICGVREGIPLVLAGMSEPSGFSAWAERVPPVGDLVSTCDYVVRDGQH
jgi:hypothetical protein